MPLSQYQTLNAKGGVMMVQRFVVVLLVIMVVRVWRRWTWEGQAEGGVFEGVRWNAVVGFCSYLAQSLLLSHWVTILYLSLKFKYRLSYKTD